MIDLFHFTKESLSKKKIVDWAYTEKLEAQTFKEFNNWILDKKHGDLSYLADHRKDMRKSLKSFFPSAQSALVFLFSYKDVAKYNQDTKNYKLASYAKGFDGHDYHHWIKEELTQISNGLGLTQDEYKLSIDMQPVLERDLAYRSGLGWFGKNSMLISKKEGSFFIIASIILNKKLKLSMREIEADHCGTCTKCIDACPTNAIVADKIIDAKKCISHFTIEIFKDVPRPPEFSFERSEIFGCDVCQSVCPWNVKSLNKIEVKKVNIGPLRFFNQGINEIKLQLENMSNREFKKIFKGTALERTGRVGLLKNIKITS